MHIDLKGHDMNFNFNKPSKIAKRLVITTLVVTVCFCQIGFSGMFYAGKSISAFAASVTGNIANDPITNTGSTTTVSDKVTINGDKAETSVGNAVGNAIVNNAINNNSKEVVINAATNAGKTDATTVKFSESAIKNLSEKTEASLIFETDCASITFDNKAVTEVANQAGSYKQIILSVETPEKRSNKLIVNLKLETSAGSVDEINAGIVTVTAPVKDVYVGKELACVKNSVTGKYEANQGTMKNDKFTFTADAFSTYLIIPQEDVAAVTSIKTMTAKAVKPAKKSAKVTLVKAENASGYQIQSSTSAKFAGAKTTKVSKNSGAAAVKGLKSKKKYYVRVRTVTTVTSGTYYSAWGKAKVVKVK